MKRILLAILALHVAATAALAQPTATGTATATATDTPTNTPTPTPTRTPTNTPTPTSTPTPTNTPTPTPTPTSETVPTPPNTDNQRLVTLLSNRTTAGASGGFWIGPFPNRSVHVCVDASCQSFRLQIETSNAPPNWVTAMVPASAVLSEGSVLPGTCSFYRFVGADAWVRANLLADNTCMVSAVLNASR